MKLFRNRKPQNPQQIDQMCINISVTMDTAKLAKSFDKLSDSFLMISEGFATAAEELRRKEK